MIEDNDCIYRRGFRRAPKKSGEAPHRVFRTDGKDTAVQQKTKLFAWGITEPPDFQRPGSLLIPLTFQMLMVAEKKLPFIRTGETPVIHLEIVPALVICPLPSADSSVNSSNIPSGCAMIFPQRSISFSFSDPAPSSQARTCVTVLTAKAILSSFRTAGCPFQAYYIR